MANSVPERPRCFNFDAQGVRVIGTFDAPWFVAKDVCSALGIGGPHVSEAVEVLEDDEKGNGIVVTLGGPQELLTVNESGLYALIFRSRKPQARIFRRWVTNEVLPAIRKTGSYSVAPSTPITPWMFQSGAGVGQLALLPRRNKEPVYDLATEHVARLLNATLGSTAPNWSGRIGDLAATAVAHTLFYWLIRNPTDVPQRRRLGATLRNRIGIDYCGHHGTHVILFATGRDRHRRYQIERREGDLAEGGGA